MCGISYIVTLFIALIEGILLTWLSPLAIILSGLSDVPVIIIGKKISSSE
jgi:hypothetical protein